MRESASVIVRLVAEGWMHSSKTPHSTITLESSARWAGALVFTALLIAIGCSSVRTTDASVIQDEAASPEDERLRARAVAIHRDAIVIDGPVPGR